MNKFEITGKVEHDVRALQDDELGAVTGGLSYPFGVRHMGAAGFDSTKNEVSVDL